MPRYAVLWELDDHAMPAGIAVEKDGYVLVDAPDSYGIPERYDGEYHVLQPDSSHIVYRPGDEGYFDQVLLDLSRVFAIGEQGVLPAADEVAVLGLENDKVFRPRMALRTTTYMMINPVRVKLAPSRWRHQPLQPTLLKEKSPPSRGRIRVAA